MLNPEVWSWLKEAIWGNYSRFSRLPPDADRKELCEQFDGLENGFNQRMLAFDKSVRSEKHVEVDALIVAVEHSLKQSLIYVPRGLDNLTRGVVAETRRMVANSFLSTGSLTPSQQQYAKEFEKHINAIRVYRKLIRRETLGDHMSAEYRGGGSGGIALFEKDRKDHSKSGCYSFSEL